MIAPCKAWSAFLTFVPLFVGIASRPSNAQTCAVEWEPMAPPGVREEHAMAYDSARGVTVLFGGYDYDPDLGGTYSAETWEWDGVTWIQKSTTGPTPRAGHAMAYDFQRGVTVLFGGIDGSGEAGDTWEWDGTNWTPRSTTGPAARSDHAMAFDNTRGVTVLFGGRYDASGYQFFGDTWEWDGTNWMLRSETGPGPRGTHALAFDSARNVTILFGGGSGQYYNGPTFGDTWEWDGGIWTLRSNSGPSPRIGHAMAYDTLRGVSVLFGRVPADPYGDTWVGETWEWDGAAWRFRSDAGPMPQSGHAMAYDSQRGVTVLQGTWTPNWIPYLPSTWEWDGVRWTQQAQPCVHWSPHPPGVPPPLEPAGRWAQAMTFDQGRQTTVMFGGKNYDGYLNDTWEWDGSSWTFRTNTGPSARALHAMAYDRRRGVTVLFGGRSWNDPNQVYYNDTWEWDGTSWTLRSASGPSPRSDLAMVYDDARGLVILFGGYFYDSAADTFTMFGDTWEWDGTSWSLRAATGPPLRSGHVMAYDAARGVTVLFGGASNNCGEYGCEFLDDTWEWDGATWAFRCTGGPSPRADHALAYDSRRNVTVLFSGLEYDITVADTWEWDGGAWRQKSVGGPSGRTQHSMVYDTARGVVWMYGGDYVFRGPSEIWEYGCYCSEPAAAAVAEAYSPCPGICYATKNRYLSFAAPPVPCGADSVALRVTLGPMPGATDCPTVPDYAAFNGSQTWVGPQVMLNGVTPTGVHQLQSTPQFDIWDAVVHVSDCNIVPCATYTIEAISNVDYPSGPYSAPLVLSTTPVWGDVVGATNAELPDGIVDFTDVSACVDRFKNALGAPPRTWCDLADNNPTQGVNLAIDFGDISAVVDAFKGKDYPFSGPTAPYPCP